MKPIPSSLMRLAVPALIGATLFGCGSPHEAQLSGQEQPDSIQIMLFGGNRSCKPGLDAAPSPLHMDMARRAIGLINQFRSRGGTVDVLTSCFTSPDKVLVSRNFSPKFEAIDPENLLNEAHSTADINHRIFVIGHSYGGWVAMKMAEDLNAQAGQLAGLVTIDPISRKDCTYTNWTNCLGAPRDFGDDALRGIKEKTAHWANFYQTTTPFLHSSEIAQADVNTKLDATHFTIDSNEAVWRHLDRMLNGF